MKTETFKVSSSKKRFASGFKKLLAFFDLYGETVNLFIDKKGKFKSGFGGLSSLCIMALTLYFTCGVLISWSNNEKATVVSSSKKYSVNEILENNRNLEYQLEYTNYYIYFAFWASLPDGRFLYQENLTKYVTFNFSYFDDFKSLSSPLDFEFCLDKYYDSFLGKSQDEIKKTGNNSNIHRICLKDPVKLGLYPKVSKKYVSRPEVHFLVYQCQNTTENKNSCASQEEIDYITQFVKIQASIPTTLYDFQNIRTPQKNYYDFYYFYLDSSTRRFVQNYLIPNFLFKDYGYFYENYKLEAANFKPFTILLNSKIQTLFQSNKHLVNQTHHHFPVGNIFSLLLSFDLSMQKVSAIYTNISISKKSSNDCKMLIN